MTTTQLRQDLTASGADPLWDTPTTAAFLLIPPATLSQWAYRGVGPSFLKVGRHRRYRPADVNAWLEANRRGSDAA